MSKKQLTNDELLAQLDQLNFEAGDTSSPSAKAPKQNDTQTEEQHLLAELQNLASQRPATRPATPRRSASSVRRDASREATRTRMSEERTDRSDDTTTTHDATHTPASEEPAAEESNTSAAPSTGGGGGGGWWGGLFATASAAVKQAEAAVKEIQEKGDAQRWAEQVKGRVGGLKGLGDELRTIALPTFTSLIHTLAPPISSHERLQIHISHDLHGYPALDPLVYSVFSRVMAQVEGGDLLVIQRGQEAAPRKTSSDQDHEHESRPAPSAGWDDGPWWRSVDPYAPPRSINAVSGASPAVATKLAHAGAEGYAEEYFAARGGIEQAIRLASEAASESNPVRSSDIFLAIQALSRTEGWEEEPKEGEEKEEGEREPEGEVCFAIYLHDPVHAINYSTLTQPIPQKWIDWIEAKSPSRQEQKQQPPSSGKQPEDQQPEQPHTSTLPDDIADIIEAGGVDPREWAADWLHESLALGVGILAQRYVARRMGLGEGSSASRRDNLKAGPSTVIESGAGEMARTGIM